MLTNSFRAKVGQAVLARGKLLHRPYIPLLREDNVLVGFFEPEQYSSVQAHLPPELWAVIEFADITGWRIESEVLQLEWRQVDFQGGEIRLDAGTTKNGEGRVFPMTDDLRVLLKAQHAGHEVRKKAGQIVPWVFVQMVAKSRGGKNEPRHITFVHEGVEGRVRDGGLPWPHPP